LGGGQSMIAGNSADGLDPTLEPDGSSAEGLAVVEWSFIAVGAPNLTASVIGNFAGFSDWRIATRASREGPGEGDDKTSADGCDRVRHMPLGGDRRRVGVGNRREGQIPRRAGWKGVVRGEGRRVRRSGSRRR